MYETIDIRVNGLVNSLVNALKDNGYIIKNTNGTEIETLSDDIKGIGILKPGLLNNDNYIATLYFDDFITKASRDKWVLEIHTKRYLEELTLLSYELIQRYEVNIAIKLNTVKVVPERPKHSWI